MYVWFVQMKFQLSRFTTYVQQPQGKHIHSAWTDFGEEMSRVQGAVVVRRPDIAKEPGMIAPAKSLDFVKTLQSYFRTFKRSLLPTRYGAAPAGSTYRTQDHDVR